MMDGKLLRPWHVVMGLGVLGAASIWAGCPSGGDLGPDIKAAATRASPPVSKPPLATSGEDAVPDASTSGVNPVVLHDQAGAFSSENLAAPAWHGREPERDESLASQVDKRPLVIVPRGVRLHQRERLWEVGFDIIARPELAQATRGLVWGFARFRDQNGVAHDISSQAGLDPDLPFVNEAPEHALSFRTRTQVHKALRFQVPLGESWRLESVKLVVHEKGYEPIAAFLPVNATHYFKKS